MTFLCWHAVVLLEGHRVAFGQALNGGQLETCPPSKGTIAMQLPFFAVLGLDLSTFWAGTLNLSFARAELKLGCPDYFFQDLEWTHFQPLETFSFWKI